jgi:hypothetical protein
VESWEIVQLAQPSGGHFDLGTGYHGDVWLDLDVLFLRPVPGGIGGWRVGIVDDAVNAGTAVAACAEAIRAQGAVPVAVASLLALGDAGTALPDRLGVPFYPATTLPSQTWPAAGCLLCAEGIPLTSGSS